MGHRAFAMWIGLVVTLCIPVAAEGEYAGDETCVACHDTLTESWIHTGHGSASGFAEAGCESCHGSAAKHIESGGDLDSIIRFGLLTPRESSQICLDCHNRTESQFDASHGIHSLNDVACTSCHNPHSTAPQGLARTGSELCGSCHQQVMAQFELPRAHPMGDGGNECSGCHNPHATATLRVEKSLYESCTNCHFEKAGPFLFGHDTMFVDGCAGCHEVHGSPNRHLLKHEPQVNLCYQCHSASVTPGWHSTPRFLNEKCTACHSAIHGSNTSPYFLEE